MNITLELPDPHEDFILTTEWDEDVEFKDTDIEIELITIGVIYRQNDELFLTEIGEIYLDGMMAKMIADSRLN